MTFRAHACSSPRWLPPAIDPARSPRCCSRGRCAARSDERIERALVAEARLAAETLSHRQAGARAELDAEADALGRLVDARVTFIAPDGTVIGDSSSPRAAAHRREPRRTARRSRPRASHGLGTPAGHTADVRHRHAVRRGRRSATRRCPSSRSCAWRCRSPTSTAARLRAAHCRRVARGVGLVAALLLVLGDLGAARAPHARHCRRGAALRGGRPDARRERSRHRRNRHRSRARSTSRSARSAAAPRSSTPTARAWKPSSAA